VLLAKIITSYSNLSDFKKRKKKLKKQRGKCSNVQLSEKRSKYLYNVYTVLLVQ